MCPEKYISTHVTGDDAGPGVCGERDDAVSGLSQDGARFLTTHDALKKGQGRRREGVDEERLMLGTDVGTDSCDGMEDRCCCLSVFLTMFLTVIMAAQ